MSTLPATLADAVRAYAHHTQRGFTFVRTDGTERHYPFQEIHAEATRRGAFLRELGLKKGDRVGFVLPEPEEFVLSFLAATNAGMVPVPMYPQLSFKNVDSYHETVGHILKASGARVLLTGKSTYDFVAPVKERTPTLERIELVESLAGFSGSFEEKVSPSDLAFLQFTSGSTSKPKGVAVTHANLAGNAQAIMIEGLEKNSETDKAVSWLPLYHDMGLIGFVVSPMFTEFASVFIPTPSFIRAPRIWLEKIHQHRGTITYAPNFAYGLVVKRIKEGDLAGIDLSCLRVAGCGA
ncbi:MAG: AMP-binding protein, partial [Polyangiaceae bacterium]|nr:AMP-binding protein [Polyangiaceae bacterium]